MSVSWWNSRLALGAIVMAAIGVGSASAQTSGEQLYKQVSPSVVTITAGDSTGSGFLVRDKRTFVTAAHVVSNGEVPVVKFGKGSFLNVSKMTVSRSLDIALLEVEDEVSAQPLALGDRDEISPGAQVFAIGTALGSLSHTFTDGLLSGVRKVGSTELVQVTSPFSPGMSGGPVLSKDARVMGVISFSFTEGQNLNIAVAAKHIRSLLAEPARATAIVTEELKREKTQSPSSQLTTKEEPVDRNGKAQALADLLSEVTWWVSAAHNDAYRIYRDSGSIEEWREVHSAVARSSRRLPLITTDGKSNEVAIRDQLSRFCNDDEFDRLATRVLSLSRAMTEMGSKYAVAIIDHRSGVTTREQITASFNSARDASVRLHSMLIDFEKLVHDLGGFLAVESRSSPKAYGMFSRLYLGVHFDADRPEVAAIRWIEPGGKGLGFRVGDVITGLRLESSDKYVPVGNWKDVYSFFSRVGNPQSVVVRVRGGREVSLSSEKGGMT